MSLIKNTMKLTDWDILEGLRGVLALHVLFVHSQLLPMNTNLGEYAGEVKMTTTLFLVLSGFSCGKGCASKEWNLSMILPFYRTRLIRIFPTHLFAQGLYLMYFYVSNTFKLSNIYKLFYSYKNTNIDSIIVIYLLTYLQLNYANQHEFSSTEQSNCRYMFLSNTFFITSWYTDTSKDPWPCKGAAMDTEVWFLSTLLFCYLLFPFFMILIRHIETTKVMPWALRLFWVQLLIATIAAVVIKNKHQVTNHKVQSYITRCLLSQFFHTRNVEYFK